MQEKDRKKLAAVMIMAIIICNYMIVPGIGRWQKENARVVKEEIHSLDEIPFFEAGKETEGSLCLICPSGGLSYGVAFGEYIFYERYFKEREFLPYDQEEHLREFERWREYDGVGYRDGELENWVIDFYNYRTGKLEKSIDLAAIEAQNIPGKQHWESSYSDIVNTKIVNGKKYLYWHVQAIRHGFFDADEKIVYDFDQDKVVHDVDLSKGGYTDRDKEFLKSIYILLDEDNCNFLKINNITPSGDGIYVSDGAVDIQDEYWRLGMIEVDMLASRLPKENSELYQEFPELKKYHAGSGKRIELYFAGYPDAEKVVRMLLEEGEEITYEGCVLSGEKSIDGEDHNISCMDDYIKWRNWNWLDE